MTETDAAALITRYIELVGAHDLDPLEELFADDLVAKTSGATFNKADWIVALRRLLPVLLRNEIRDVFSHDDKAVAIYDFVTDTEAGPVVCVEWITASDGKISEVELIFEKANWPPVATAIQARATAS